MMSTFWTCPATCGRALLAPMTREVDTTCTGLAGAAARYVVDDHSCPVSWPNRSAQLA